MKLMESSWVSKLLFLLSWVLYMSSVLIKCSVTYDSKAIVINGQRRILISGSIHYPRSTPEVLLSRTHVFSSLYIFLDMCVY